MIVAEEMATRRLALRPVDEGDVVSLTAWWNDPTVRRMHGLGLEPLPEAAVRRWLGQDERALAWVARERAGGNPVGVVEMSLRAATGGAPAFELGIALDAAARGRGFGREMIEGACAWAFDRCGAFEVVAEVRVDNAVARRAFRACAFGEVAERGETVYMQRTRADRARGTYKEVDPCR